MIVNKNRETLETITENLEIKGRSLWQDAYNRFMMNKAAVSCLFFLSLIVIFVLLGTYISPFTYDDIDWEVLANLEELGRPSLTTGHYFGTDTLGRDMFARTVQGGQISMLVGLFGSLVAIVIGTLWGAVSGYLGGIIDSIMMRILEILDSFPFMFFVIILVTMLGHHVVLIFVAIGAVSWLPLGRVVRGLTMSIKNKEYIEAALASGVKTPSIILKHVIPNVIGIVMVFSSLLVPQLIMFESFLSFLGLGVQEPLTSWGQLISQGATTMEIAWWQMVFPAMFLVVTLFCFNFIGDGLRDALDPKDR